MEYSFINIVLIIAVVLLIVILTYIGILMFYYSSSIPFPPTSSICPDYWMISTDGSGCIIPDNSHPNIGSIYKYKDNTITPYGLPSTNVLNKVPSSGDSSYIYNSNSLTKYPAWTGAKKSPICGQKSWANQYGINWDGISNYNNC